MNAHPLQTLIGRIDDFEYRWSDQYAAASIEIPSNIKPPEGAEVMGTGIRLMFRPDQGAPEDQRGLWVVGAPIGAMRLRDAPAELLLRAIPVMREMESVLEARSDELRQIARYALEALADG
jgi:hypothetical protein